MGKLMLGPEVMFPSDYLAWEEFKGKEVTLTIKKVWKEDLRKVDGSSERKTIMTFEETPQKLVMNKTRGGMVAEALGIEQGLDWPGHRITLYPGKYKRTTKMLCAKKATGKPAKTTSPPEQQAKSAGAGESPTPLGDDKTGAPDILAELDAILVQDVILYDDYARAFEMADPDKQFEIDEDMQGFIDHGDHYAAVRWIRRKVAGE